jgi:hypothetical protein
MGVVLTLLTNQINWYSYHNSNWQNIEDAEVGNLSDVDLTGLENKDLLRYDSTATKWKVATVLTTTTTTTITTTTTTTVTTTTVPFSCSTHALNGTNEMNTTEANQGGNTWRMIIPSSRLDNDASKIRVLFDGQSYDMDISEVWIGHASGTNQDFDGNQVQLKVGNSGSFSVPASGEQWSDEATFNLDSTKDLILSVYLTPSGSGGSGRFGKDITSQIITSLHWTTGDYAGDTSFSGTLYGSNQLAFITAICVTES